jgi:hypothetical protein
MLDFTSSYVGDSIQAVSPATPHLEDRRTSAFDEREVTMKGILTVLVCAAAAIGPAGYADAQDARFTLSGLVVVEGGGRAWLQEPTLTQNQPVAVRPGETIGPYRLTKIYEDRVELVGPEGTISVLLAGIQGATAAVAAEPPRAAPAPPPQDTSGHEMVVLPPGPPLAEIPQATPRVDFGSLLRGLGPR